MAAQNSSAVDGLSARAISYDTAPTARDDPRREILSLGTLRLGASCTGGDVEVFATTTRNDSYIRSSNEEDPHFNVGEEVEVQNANNGTSIVGYDERASNDVVTATLVYDESIVRCHVAGTAFGN